jgi:hypothetical protein
MAAALCAAVGRSTGDNRAQAIVFGSTGAAFSARARDRDLQEGRELFDEDFFAFRKTRIWRQRAQLGWRVVYEPTARGEPAIGPAVEPSPDARALNYHSVKGRFLKLKNCDRMCAVMFAYMWWD